MQMIKYNKKKIVIEMFYNFFLSTCIYNSEIFVSGSTCFMLDLKTPDI